MKILCTSLFKNTWISYWTKFFKSRNHQVIWIIGHKRENVSECVKKANNYDAILCMWGSLWAREFLNAKVKPPVYVICRSFELFKDTKLGGIDTVPLEKARQVFMLNESHYDLLSMAHPKVKPLFIKNGIDIEEWKLQEKSNSAHHKIAWICNLNFKKGVMLAVQTISEIRKIDSLVTLEHIGDVNSLRMYLYIQNIMPYLHTQFYHNGHSNSHKFVRDFLRDKRYLISCSMVEGNPLNVIEAAATGCQPLVHRYPGVEHQFPDDWIWNGFDNLREMYQRPYEPEKYRQYIVDNYDYRNNYKPVAEVIECIT